MTDKYDPEIGFELGWDFARLGKRPDATKAAPPDVKRGYHAGLVHFVRPQRIADRFEAKWLQLRLNALRRNRVVQPDVTPSFLRMIDTPVCPVSLSTLTHATQTGSDWSVDRINNDGAYATWNLMVLSARVNKAKGRLSFTDVQALANDGLEHHGLAAAEWRRLVCLMAGACEEDSSSFDCLPLLTALPKGSIAPLYLHFQHIVLQCAACASLRNALLKALRAEQSDAIQRLRLKIACERLALLIKDVDYPYDALADAGVQAMLAGWFRSLSDGEHPVLVRLSSVFGGAMLDDDTRRMWCLETKGYYEDRATLEA